jgi:transcriptional regulator with XRE-family HTH domain
MTQKETAERAEMSIEWVSLIEQGRVNPTLYIIVQLALAFSVAPSELLAE